MKIAVDRRDKSLRLQKEFLVKKNEISDNASYLRVYLDSERTLGNARAHYAASRIQGIIRGFLDRIFFREESTRRLSAIKIQSLIRGRFGRKRWMREYWLLKAVVKTPAGLKNILQRSRVIRVVDSEFNEMFDPVFDAIWYFNPKTEQSQWDCPFSIQKDLICHWNGFHEYGGLPSQGPCRQVFDNVTALHSHLRNAHKWFCEACEYKNHGMSFPVCQICENVLSGEGKSGMKELERHTKELETKMSKFIEGSSPKKNPDYSVKKEVINAAVDKRAKKVQEFRDVKALLQSLTGVPGAEEEMEKRKEDQIKKEKEVGMDAILNKKHTKTLGGGHRINIKKMPWEHVDMDKKNKTSVDGYEYEKVVSLLEPTESSVDPMDSIRQILRSREKSSGRGDGKRARSTKRGFSSTVPDDPNTVSSNENLLASIYFDPGAPEPTIPLPGEYDPLLIGSLTTDEFDEVTDWQEPVYDDASEDSYSTRSNSNLAGLIAESGKHLNQRRLVICEKFTKGKCSLTTCPMAHPGERDNCQTLWTRIPGKISKVPYVLCCPEGMLGWRNCPDGKECKNYHIYIRPDTVEIIRKLYPTKVGIIRKEYSGGAIAEGNVRDGRFSGYAVMTWKNGSVYIGDWENSKRNGWGIFRTESGIEYIGEWKDNQRHGWGILSHPNGEEYVGEWSHGKMHGAGRLSSKNNDVYEGQFANHTYDGIGSFSRANGDRFMGTMQKGFAIGLGVLALSTGEKYKGYFDRNSRHGKGACAYPNGSRYAGSWWRGAHEGFGIYVTDKGERYVGNWRANKKDGVGRYYFMSGDMYDGEFKANKAHGMGFYFHSNGNIYKGQWENDKRNGRGTYQFLSGSVYTGNWVDNMMHGKGKFDYNHGCHYRGEFQSNMKEGKGIYIWNNQNKYTGEWKNNAMKGFGVMEYWNLHKYVGEWDNNKKNGQGIFTFNEGHMFDGQFVDDVRNGKGKMIYFKGSAVEETYDGDWRNDKRHGEGTYIYRVDDGSTYEGQWDNDIRHGFGKITHKDGSFYRGDLKFEKMWGKGIYVGSDGSQYDGEWSENMRHGHGTSMSPDGIIYTGSFVRNMKQGEGTEIRQDGGKYSGTWDCGIITGQGTAELDVGQGAIGGPTSIKVKVFSF
jgi:hypothetical protein